MQEQDIQLAARCARLAEQSRHAATWLADNRETVGSECTTLQKEMRRAARFFGKCEQAARRKMCVGVFGPSQSGKSYLISALARDSRGDLLADFCGRTSDFITEINPEGGKESTGLVTRFTTTPPQGLTPDFPIRLRLLSEMDVVRVLANTYYADCEHKQMPDADAMRSALERLTQTARQSSPGASSVTADDVEDLREYLNRNFLSKPRVQMLQQGYWAQAVSLAPLLPLSYRAELFGIIWNNQPKFQQLFLELCQALEALGNPAEADCPLEALLPRQTSIIDVALLAGLGTNSAEDRLTLLGKDGRKAALPRAVVTALTAEITIFMREQPDDFFSYTDLLDFPGYRSRLKILDLDKELEREGALQNLFLRGKVAYLFERYCEEHELTSMLLCIGPGNQEVQDLPRAVYDWICSTHGENPAHRAGKAPSLFFVLTKMDMEFEKKAGSPSVEQRWNTRLQSSLLDFFGKQHDWPTNWDGAHPFRNIFLLRNPNFRCEAIFTFDAQGNESGVRPDQIAYVEEVRRAFVDSPLVRRHVDDPEAVWQAAMTLNDGGISLLRQRLRPLCNPELKRHQIGVGLDEQAERVLTALRVYYQSDDREELRRQKEALARNLAVLLARVAQNQTFGEMLHRLQVSDHDLYVLCAQGTSASGCASRSRTYWTIFSAMKPLWPPGCPVRHPSQARTARPSWPKPCSMPGWSRSASSRPTRRRAPSLPCPRASWTSSATSCCSRPSAAGCASRWKRICVPAPPTATSNGSVCSGNRPVWPPTPSTPSWTGWTSTRAITASRNAPSSSGTSPWSFSRPSAIPWANQSSVRWKLPTTGSGIPTGCAP